MTKNIVFAILCGVLLLSACGSPAPASETSAPAAATQAPVEAATNTAEPPTPTATPMPEPQVISADNIANLAFQELVEVPRKPNLRYPVFTNDSQKILMNTETGVDVLNASTLELETSYSGLRVDGQLADGRFYGFQGRNFGFIDLQSGELMPLDVQIAESYTFSPKANKLAYVQNDTTLQVLDLETGQATPISIESPESLYMFFNGDGSVLVTQWDLTWPQGFFIAYNAESGEQLYKDGGYATRLDDERMLAQPPKSFTDPEIHTIADNQSTGDSSPLYTTITASGIPDPQAPSVDVELFFSWEREFVSISANGKRAVGIANNSTGAYSVLTTMDVETHTPVAMVNLTDKFVEPVTGAPYPIIQPSVYIAPDGDTFLVAWPSGEVELRKFETADVLVESDQYGDGNSSLAFSPDGTLIAWADLQGINVYNWQTGEFLLQASHPNFTWEVGRVEFVGQDSVFVDVYDSLLEPTKWGQWYWSSSFANSYIWDLTSGEIKKSFTDLSLCGIQSDSQFIKCAASERDGYNGVRFTGTKIFNVSNTAEELATAKVNEYVIPSPTGEGYAKCTAEREGITLKEGKAAALTLPYLCQPFFFGNFGDTNYLFLQNGTVIDVVTGEPHMQLDVREISYVFDAEFTYSGEWLYDGVLSSQMGPLPHFLSANGYILINNSVFDSESGALLAQLSGIDSVSGIMMSEDGKTLMVLTPRGLEQWQVLQ